MDNPTKTLLDNDDNSSSLN